MVECCVLLVACSILVVGHCAIFFKIGVAVFLNSSRTESCHRDYDTMLCC